MDNSEYQRDDKHNEEDVIITKRRIPDIIFFGIITVLVLLLVKFVIFFPTVGGQSMEPTFKNGDLLICKRPLVTAKHSRGDIVIIKGDMTGGDQYVKRIVALPGETVIISGGVVYADGNAVDIWGAEPTEDPGLFKSEVTLGDDEYLVLGDNRNHSNDSRAFGAVKESDITGTYIFGR